MDGRGGCCIARYATGACDMSKVDSIMLRFRPIAPKPVSCGSVFVAGSSTTENNQERARTVGGRGKRRRYVRDDGNVKKRNNSRKRKSPSDDSNSSSGGSVFGGRGTMVTLPLLPENPDRKHSPARGSPICLSFNDRTVVVPEPKPKPKPEPVGMVGSRVTVECMTDAWVEGVGLGCTDEEKVMNLDRNTSPGFISDGSNRVKWANKAYREMTGLHANDGREAAIRLEMKETVSFPVTCQAFACRVRVTWLQGKEKGLLTFPCDVWRMRSGGFAWRLDVKTALCLGR